MAEADRQHARQPDRGVRRGRRRDQLRRRSTACRRPRRRRRSPPGWRRRDSASSTVNYKLRDWLFSRQRYWGEPFPILHGPNGDTRRAVRRSRAAGDACPSWRTSSRPARPSRPLAQGDRLGQRHRRRQAVHARDEHDAAVGRLVLVLPALHRPEERPSVLPTRRRRSTGCRSTCTSAAPSTPCCTCSTRGSGTRCCSTAATSRAPEPFQRLVNQGMILGEIEYTVRRRNAEARCEEEVATKPGREVRPEVEKPSVEVDVPADKMSKAAATSSTPTTSSGVRRRQPAALRDVHGAAGGGEAVEHEGRRGRVPLPRPRLAADRRRRGRGR